MDMLEAIKAVRAVLVQYGWTQFTHRDAHGRHCLNGAISRAILWNPDKRRVQDFIMAHLRVGGWDIVHWNDHPTRTAADVFALLDEIIAEIETQRCLAEAQRAAEQVSPKEEKVYVNA